MSLKNNKRISWDVYALKIAKAAALRSEDPFKKVGACALDKEHRVIGVAYNGIGSGKVVSAEFWKNRNRRRPYIIHAETNLLSLIKRGECETLACTLLPCRNCATAIIAHGIKRIIYNEIYKRDTLSLKIFKFYNVEVIRINKI